MRVRYTVLAEGPGPSEMTVGVLTTDGHQEEVVISNRNAQNGSFEVGAPLLAEESRCLVELPRESMSGRWRIWVARSELASGSAAEAAE